MCPACMATLALIVASAASTGGLAAFSVKKLGAKAGAGKNLAAPESKENG